MKKIEPKIEPKPKPRHRKSAWRGVTTWIWLAVVVMLVFEALIANSQATSGQQLSNLQDEQSSLSVQIDQLERQVAQAGSLQNVKQQATDKLGMQPVSKNILYMTWPTPEKGQQ